LKNTSLVFLVGGISLATVLGCSSNPHKAEKIETTIEKSEVVSGDEAVGIKNGNMVVQKKVSMAEEIRRLQNDVYSLEDRVYGNRKYGSLGLYGVLRDCKAQIADKANGGEGKLLWTESADRITDKEDEFKIGVDEKEKLVGITEEFLKDRIQRFRGYRNLLEKRQDEYEEKMAVCQTELKSRKYDKLKAEEKTLGKTENN
jgi:hypothetical protein